LASRATFLGPNAIEEWIKGERKLHISGSESRNLDKNVLLEFAKAAQQFLKRSDVQCRTEGSRFNLFCEKITVLEEIDSTMQQWIYKISGPTTQEEHDFLTANGHKKILRDKLPAGDYKYRVYFKNSFAKDKRESFLAWTRNFGDKIKISKTSERWLLGNRFYAQDPFMYVKDDKMLSMIGIYLSGHVKKVEEFIERNTVLAA
jgi:hypothetical protein